MKNVPISKSIPYNIDENYLELTRKVHLILHVGRLMMENSADTSRIVRTMQRTAAYAGILATNCIFMLRILLDGQCERWQLSYDEIAKMLSA